MFSFWIEFVMHYTRERNISSPICRIVCSKSKVFKKCDYKRDTSLQFTQNYTSSDVE